VLAQLQHLEQLNDRRALALLLDAVEACRDAERHPIQERTHAR
jgi:hypothetical protein